MSEPESQLVDVGRILGVYGIQGWVKVHSDTQPREQLFHYQPWWLKTAHGVRQVWVDAHRPHGKGLVAHIEGLDDRDEAAAYNGVTIAVDSALLPELPEGEYYWHQLCGLTVYTEDGQQRLGRVRDLLETGANDVLVVAPDAESIDERERLIPWVPEQYVGRVDLAAGYLEVRWDPEF